MFLKIPKSDIGWTQKRNGNVVSLKSLNPIFDESKNINPYFLMNLCFSSPYFESLYHNIYSFMTPCTAVAGTGASARVRPRRGRWAAEGGHSPPPYLFSCRFPTLKGGVVGVRTTVFNRRH